MLGIAQWNAPAFFLSFISMSCMTPPMLQPVRSPSLSPHLHYQMNSYSSYQNGRMTSFLGLHFPTILLHLFLVILLVDYKYILWLHYLNIIQCYTWHQLVHAVVFTYIAMACPTLYKERAIEWLLSWTLSNKCMLLITCSHRSYFPGCVKQIMKAQQSLSSHLHQEVHV